MMDYKDSTENKELTELEDTLRALYSEALATKDSRIEDIFDRMLKYKIGTRSMMKEEIWKQFETKKSIIKISNYGNVESIKWNNKTINENIVRINYFGRPFIGYKYAVHRMVYELFVGQIPKGYVIHHIDLNKKNNNLDNLFLCTISEHMILHNLNERNKHVEIGRKTKGRKRNKLSQDSKDKIRDAIIGLRAYNNGIDVKMFKTEAEANNNGYFNKGYIKYTQNEIPEIGYEQKQNVY